MPETITPDQLKNLAGPELWESSHDIIERWWARGDGVAVYTNQDLSHPDAGHKKYVSYGSAAAQLESEVPPKRLPDIGGSIGWRYQLTHICPAPRDD